jgi:uncharacterized protein YkwD
MKENKSWKSFLSRRGAVVGLSAFALVTPVSPAAARELPQRLLGGDIGQIVRQIETVANQYGLRTGRGRTTDRRQPTARRYPEPTPRTRPAPSRAPQPSVPVDLNTLEMRITQRVNDVRSSNGKGTLHHNVRLAEVARDYSRRMAEENFFAHTAPDGSTLGQRVSQNGIHYRLVGENLFMGRRLSSPVDSAVKGWLDSPGHRDNMLTDSFTQTGVGVWRAGDAYYATQLFLVPAR